MVSDCQFPDCPFPRNCVSSDTSVQQKQKQRPVRFQAGQNCLQFGKIKCNQILMNNVKMPKEPKRKNSNAENQRRKSSTGETHRKVRKKKKRVTIGLTPSDIAYLNKHTRFDEKDIMDWYRGFKQDCPTGQLSKEKVLTMYSMILPEGNAAVFVDQIFRIFDKDGNGSIDFKEFMLATDMTSSGSAQEKLRWAFKMYDKDASGVIELKEMIEIVGTLYELEGVTTMAAERAQSIFGNLDLDGNGEITEEEFIKGCMLDKALVGTLQGDRDDDDRDDDDD